MIATDERAREPENEGEEGERNGFFFFSFLLHHEGEGRAQKKKEKKRKGRKGGYMFMDKIFDGNLPKVRYLKGREVPDMI